MELVREKDAEDSKGGGGGRRFAVREIAFCGFVAIDTKTCLSKL